MTHLSQILLALACLGIAASALLAIFHPRFRDTLLQRCGLSLAGSGALLTIYQLVNEASADRQVLLTLLGAAVYAAASVLRAWRSWRLPHTP